MILLSFEAADDFLGLCPKEITLQNRKGKQNRDDCSGKLLQARPKREPEENCKRLKKTKSEALCSLSGSLSFSFVLFVVVFTNSRADLPGATVRGQPQAISPQPYCAMLLFLLVDLTYRCTRQHKS